MELTLGLILQPPATPLLIPKLIYTSNINALLMLYRIVGLLTKTYIYIIYNIYIYIYTVSDSSIERPSNQDYHHSSTPLTFLQNVTEHSFLSTVGKTTEVFAITPFTGRGTPLLPQTPIIVLAVQISRCSPDCEISTDRINSTRLT